MVGMEVPRSEQASRSHSDSKPLYGLLESVAQFYQAALRDSPTAVAYLKARGLGGEVAKRFGIGYAPDGWDALQQQFVTAENALVKTGMLKQSDSGSRIYQRFRHRIMFPIRDRRGRVIAFGGRVLDNEEPKYLNSPETPLFHKGSELYGLYESRKAAQQAGNVIVVEGYMDVVALAQHGVNNAVATLGTAANQQHSEMLFKLVPSILFCFDGDRAGRAAAWRALVSTLPCLEDGRDAQFLFLPDGEDPDSIVSSSGAAGFHELLSTRLPIIDFLYKHLAADVDMQSIGGKALLADKVKPLVASIPLGVYKQLALRRLETLIGLSMGSNQATTRNQSGHTNRQHRGAGLSPMSRAVLLLLQYPGVVAEQPADALTFDPDIRGAEVLAKLLEYCVNDPKVTTARLLERFRDTGQHTYLSKLAARPFMPDGSELEQESAVKEFAHNLQQLQAHSQKTQKDKVDVSARTGLLSIRRL